MKRFLFALGLLATVVVSESSAGYIVVRIVLEGGSSSGGLEGGGAPGMTGLGGPGAAMPFRPPGGGAFPFAPPGPMGAGMGPMGPGFGPTAPRMAPPGPMGMGAGQYGGMLPTPMSTAPPRGNFGSSLGPPGMGSLGPSPMGMGMSGGPMGGHTAGGPHDPKRSVVVVVPTLNDLSSKHPHPFYLKFGPHHFNNPNWDLSVKHPFGYANLLFDNSQIQVYLDLGPEAPKGKRTRQSDLVEKHDKWKRNPAELQLLLDLVTQALEDGMVDEAGAWADDLLARAQQKKAKSSPQVDRFAQAYAQVQKAVAAPARNPSDGPQWKDNWLALSYPGANDQTSKHYYLIYWDAPEAERSRRIAQLEENFRAFFLQHAVRGVALPVPDRPLVAILPKSGLDVVRLAAATDGLPRVADAFYTPDYGVLVLSPERLDGVGQSFQKQVQQIYQTGVSRTDLLEGKGPRIDTSGTVKDAKKPDEVARMMTWALVERYLQEEAEWSGVSREASRQLLYATGVLPRNVVLPTWLSEGAAGYYHRPKGPVFTTVEPDQKPHVTVALTTGYGGPNFVRQKQFAELVRHKQFTDPGQLLRNVVTDAYFAAVREGLDADDPKLPLPPKPKPAAGSAVAGAFAATPPPENPEALRRRRQEFLVDKAYSTAWALYFYLAKNHADGLDRYLAELNKLPRDLPLDESTRVAVFARAFNLTTSPARTDARQTFAEFGAAWLQAIQAVPPGGVEIALTDLSPATSGGTNTPGMTPSGAEAPPPAAP